MGYDEIVGVPLHNSAQIKTVQNNKTPRTQVTKNW